MVAWDSEDRCWVILVGEIELIVVAEVFAVVVDDVAKVVEKGGLLRKLRLADLPSHVVGHVLLGARAVDAAGVPDHVEDYLAGFLDGAGSGWQDRRQVETEGGPVGPDRREPILLVAWATGLNRLEIGLPQGAEKETFNVVSTHGALLSLQSCPQADLISWKAIPPAGNGRCRNSRCQLQCRAMKTIGGGKNESAKVQRHLGQ